MKLTGWAGVGVGRPHRKTLQKAQPRGHGGSDWQQWWVMRSGQAVDVFKGSTKSQEDFLMDGISGVKERIS